MNTSFEVVFLSELNGRDGRVHREDVLRRYRSVRVTGFLNFLQASSRYCQISHNGSSLFVDLRIADMTGLKIDHLYQFAGELRAYDPEPDNPHAPV